MLVSCGLSLLLLAGCSGNSGGTKTEDAGVTITAPADTNTPPTTPDTNAPAANNSDKTQ